MKVLHTIPRLKINGGGPPLSTSLTVKGIMDRGMDVEILTYELESKRDVNIIDGDFVHFMPSPREKKIAYSNHFNSFLRTHNNYDLYHCHGIWQYPSYITAKRARAFGKPYILTPRGMLYPQDLKKSEWVKRLALNLFMRNDLQKAACVHATCDEEMNHIRALGITAPVAVIPNPIDTLSFENDRVRESGRKRFGYLGRVHPRKNIERLIYAWKELGDSVDDCELVVIGAGDEKYHQFLKAEANRLGLTNVIFTGFLSGKEKTDAVHSLSFLAVPSDFENFGMIVAEALIQGIPVISSKGTPWQELETHCCGWWIDNDVDSFVKTFKKAIAISETERLKMGENGMKLIKEQYSVRVISKKMESLYNWILGNGDVPEFVHL